MGELEGAAPASNGINRPEKPIWAFGERSEDFSAFRRERFGVINAKLLNEE